MAIPDLTADGFLPEGVHDCIIEEIRDRFGQFQESDVRCRLFEKLDEFIRQARLTKLIFAVIIDGSFVTAKASPNDIDLIVVLKSSHDFSAELRPMEYNTVSAPGIRRTFRFDALVGCEGERELDEHIDFFSRVRDRAELRKGMLRIKP